MADLFQKRTRFRRMRGKVINNRLNIFFRNFGQYSSKMIWNKYQEKKFHRKGADMDPRGIRRERERYGLQ